MKKPFRFILLLLILAALAGGGYWWYKEKTTADPLAGIISTKAERGDIEVAVLASGSLRPVKLVAVGAQVSGRVTSLKVKVGQTVKSGDLIAEIDNLTQTNALKTAEASLAASEAQLDEKKASLVYAESALQRAGFTLARNATSRDSYESAEATVKSTKAQIAAIDAQIVEARVAVDSAKVDLGYTRVTAPIDGTVLLVVTQEGQTVNASQSAPTIVVLGQIDRMTVRAEISEADATRVKPGQDVYFTILGDLTKRWDAKLASIDPAPDSLRSDSEITTSTSTSSSSSSSSSTSNAIYYYGRFDVPNPDGLLKTYMTAQVHIVLGSAKNVVTVPTSALRALDAEGHAKVEVIAADKSIATREVEVGLNDKSKVEIRSGLKEGELVVSSRASGTFESERPRGPMGM
ncbi:MAG: hypothetical protein RLZZ444_1425 [Pseudomonadota bacterium]